MITLTVRRLRAILAAARSDSDAIDILRRHCISFTHSAGRDPELFRVPCRTGSVVLSRSGRRSALEIHGPAPVPYNPLEV